MVLKHKVCCVSRQQCCCWVKTRKVCKRILGLSGICRGQNTKVKSQQRLKILSEGPIDVKEY